MRRAPMTEGTSDMANSRIASGIDVGGSGIKAAVVDVEAGRLRSERLRVVTPNPSTPDAVLAAVARLIKRLAKANGLGESTPVGIGLPGVTIDGVLKSAANIDQAWIDFPVVERLTRVLGRRVSIINDADAAGIAEMSFGAGKGCTGVVIVLTFGTGIGSSIFVDGHLVPNTEFGHMEVRGKDAEHRAADRIRTEEKLSWKKWADRVDEFLHRMELLFSPDLFIIGGGVSKKHEKFIPRLTVKAEVVPAKMMNEAGIIGAAMAARHLAKKK